MADNGEPEHAPSPSETDDPGLFVVLAPPPARIPDFDKDGEDDDPPALNKRQQALQVWLEDAFGQGVEVYMQRVGPFVDADIRAVAEPGPEPLSSPPTRLPELVSRLPRLTINVAADWREQPEEERSSIEQRSARVIDTAEIVFDGGLMVALLELYLCDGWQPLVAIGEELDRRLERLQKMHRDVPSAGISRERMRELAQLAPFEPAAFLFRLARNAVGQLVRDELAPIEHAAGIRLESRIATGQTVFATHDGQLKWTEVQQPPLIVDGKTVPQSPLQRLEDRELASTFKQALKEAVECRGRLDDSLNMLAAYRSATEGTTTKRASIAAKRDYEKAVSSGRNVYERFVADARMLADLSKTQLRINSPLLLLVFPSLKRGFHSSDGWESLLHSRLAEMRGGLAALRDHARPDLPFTTRLPGVDTSEPASWKALLALDTPVQGVEQFMAEQAFAGVAAGKSEWLPLASEEMFYELVGAIEKDSLTFIVGAHYLQTLAGLLERQLRQQEAAREFWLSFSRFAAAASIAALFFPGAPVVLAAAGLADLVLLAQTVGSATRELERIEELEQRALAESSSTIEGFRRLGELVLVREELFQNLSKEAMIMLAVTLAGMPNFRLARRALNAWGFYNDMETLVASDGTFED